jgi:hypothetical protein
VGGGLTVELEHSTFALSSEGLGIIHIDHENKRQNLKLGRGLSSAIPTQRKNEFW